MTENEYERIILVEDLVVEWQIALLKNNVTNALKIEEVLIWAITLTPELIAIEK